MSEGQTQGAGPAQRTVEGGVAVATAVFGLIVIAGSLQVGIGWGPEGPKSGFFPFYLGLVIVAASAVNLLEVAVARSDKTFADWGQLRQVLAVMIPTAVYVTVIPWAGVYISSMLLIAVFMIWLGRYRPLYAVTVAVAIIVGTYLTFEKWFLVPLPKGPIEEFFGL
jgi:putative tricarboxylic transport membrane protein